MEAFTQVNNDLAAALRLSRFHKQHFHTHRICLHQDETLPCENTQFSLYSNVHYFKNFGQDFIFGNKLIRFSN